MDYDVNGLKTYGLNVEEGLRYTGGNEKYISAILRYMRNHDRNKEEITSLLGSNDVEGYKIRVHALKSNSRMIGAMELGSEFEALEKAANDNDINYIKDNNDRVMVSYDKLVENLAPLKELGDVRPAAELDREQAKSVSDELLKALDEFDDEAAKKLADKLSGYPFRITQKQKLKEAIRYIEDFQYDEAADIIKEIYPSIE